MRKKTIMLGVCFTASLLMCLLLTGCGGIHRDAAENDDVYIFGAFFSEGEARCLQQNGKTQSVKALTAETDASGAIASLKYGRDPDALWHATSGRIYYSEDSAVYSCDKAGGDKQTVWTMPDSGKKDFVRIVGADGDWLLLRAGYGIDNTGADKKYSPFLYESYDYYSLNLHSLTATKILGDVAYDCLPSILCLDSNTAYYLQLERSEGYNPVSQQAKDNTTACHVIAINLPDGGQKELTVFSTDASISSACGTVVNESLYFVYDYASACHVPLAGGELKYHSIRVNGLSALPVCLQEHEGRLYLLLWDSVTYPTATICCWNTETDEMNPLGGDNGVLSEGIGFELYRETCCLYSPTEVSVFTFAENSTVFSTSLKRGDEPRTLQDAVLMDSEACLIMADRLTWSENGAVVLELTADNKCEKTLVVNLEQLSVNRVMMPTPLFEQVGPGQRMVIKVPVSQKKMTEAEIEAIDCLDVLLEVTEAETNNRIAYQHVPIVVGETDTRHPPTAVGDILLDTEYCTISFVRYLSAVDAAEASPFSFVGDQGEQGHGFVLQVINKTDDDVSLTIPGGSLDEKTFGLSWMQTISADSSGFFTVFVPYTAIDAETFPKGTMLSLHLHKLDTYEELENETVTIAPLKEDG